MSHASHTRVFTEGVIIQDVDAARCVFIGRDHVVIRVIYRADRHIHGRRFNIARRRRHCVSEAVAAVVVLIWCVGHGAICIEGHGAVRTLSHASHTRVFTEGVIIQDVDAARCVFIGRDHVVIRVIYRADRHIHGRRFNIARRRRHCVSEAVAAVVVLIWCVGHGAICIEGHGAVRTLSHASHTRVFTEGVIIQDVDAARCVFIGRDHVVIRVIYRADRHIHGRRFNIARRRRHCVSEAVAAVVVLIWCVGHGAICIEGHGAVRTLSHASHTRVFTEGVIIQDVDAARCVFIGRDHVVIRVIYRADRHIHGRRFNIARRRRHCVSEAVAAVVVLIWCVGHGAICIEGHGAVRTLSHASHTRVFTEGVIIQDVDAARCVFIGRDHVVIRVIYRADRHIHGRRFNIARRRRHCVSEAVAAVVVLIWCVGHGAICIEGHGAVRTLSHASHTRVFTEGVIIQDVDAARCVFIGRDHVVIRVIYRADRHIHGRRFNIARRRRHCVSEAVAAVVVLIWCVGHGAICIEGHGAVRTLSHASHTRVFTEGVIIQDVDAARCVFIGRDHVVIRVIYRADRHIHVAVSIARRRRHCVSEAVAAVVVLIWCVGHGAICIEGHGAVRTLSHASHTRVFTEGVIIQDVDAARCVFIGRDHVVIRVIYRADRHIHGRRFNIARRRRHCVSEAVAAVVVLIWCVGHGAICIEGHGAVRTLSHASHTRVFTEGVIIQDVDAARCVFIGRDHVVIRVIYRADRHIHGRRFNIARRRRHCVSEAVAAVVVLIWCVGHGAICIEGHGAVRTLSHASHTRVFTEGVIIQDVDAARCVFIGRDHVVIRVIYRADRHIHGRRFNIARRRRHCVSEAVAAVVVLIWCVGHGAICIEGHGAVRTLSHASHTRVFTEGVIIQDVDAARCVFIGRDHVVIRVIYRADRHIHGRRFNIARRRRHCVSEAVAAVVVLIWCVGHGAICIEGHGAVRTLSHASHTRVFTEGVIIQDVDAARCVFIGRDHVVIRVIYRADRHIHGRRFNIARRRRHCVSEAVAAVVVLIWCVGHGAICIEGHGAVRTLSHASHTRVFTEGVIIQDVDAARCVFIGRDHVVIRVIYRADRHIHGRRFNIARRRRHCVSEAVAAVVVLIWCVGHGAICIEGHGAVRTLSHASHTRVFTEGVIIQDVDAARCVFIGRDHVVIRVIYRADRHIHGRRFNIARRRRHCVSEAVAAVVVLIWCVGHGAICIEGHGAVRTLSHASHTRVFTEGVIIQDVDAARCVFIGRDHVVIRVIYRADRHIHGRRFNIARRRRHCVSEAVAAVVVLIWCVGHGAICIEGHGAVRTLSHASHTRVFTEGVIIQDVDAARCVFIGRDHVVIRVIYRADRHIHGRRFNIARRRRHCVSEAVAAVVVLIWCVGHGAICIEGHGAVRTLSHASHTRVFTEGVIIQDVDAARCVFIGRDHVVIRVIYRADRHIHGRRFNIARRRRHCVSEAVAAVVVLIWCVGHGAICIEGHGAVRTLSHASHTRVFTEGVIIQDVDAARCVFIGRDHVVIRVIYRADRHIHGRRFNIARRRRHCVSEAVAAVVVLIWCVGHGAICIEGHGAVRTLSHASHTRVFTEGVIIQDVDAARCVFIGRDHVVIRVIYRADRHIHGRRFNIARRRRHCVSEAVAAVVVLIWCVGHGAICIEGHGAVRTLSHASHTRVFTEGVIIQDVDAARCVFIGRDHVVIRVIYRADRHIHGRRFNIARRRRHCVSEAVAAVVVLIWCVGHGAICIEGHGAVRTLSHASHTRVFTEGVIIQDVDAARCVFIGRDHVVIRVIYRADRHIHGRRFNIARRRRHCVSEAVAAVVVLIWCVGHGAICIEGHGAVRTLSHASHTRVFTEGVIIQDVDAARCVFIGRDHVVIRVIYRADRHIHGQCIDPTLKIRHNCGETIITVIVCVRCVGPVAVFINNN